MSDEDDTFDVVSQSSQLAPLPTVPQNQGPQSIPLSTLLDHAIQKTYQELTIKTQLLPGVPDLDRKIEIVQFAHRTRQLFVRLLAVVKWAKSAAKVDVCTAISCFLNQQCGYFVDTADFLFQLSTGFLSEAKLPVFQIPAAVDVLTLGSYPRLPLCIKTRFVPDDVITPKEQACLLQRLNQVLRHRIISQANDIPAEYIIKNGTVTIRVENEFEATLTVLGETPDTPWTLLILRILIAEYCIGEGTDLIHPMQVHYLHQLVQTRIQSSQNPILELYDILRSFCLSLRLDIFYCQTQKLIFERLNDNVMVDEYRQGQRLSISYWRNNQPAANQTGSITGQSSTNRISGSIGNQSINYRLSIEICENRDSQSASSIVDRKSLRISHVPSSDADLPVISDYVRRKDKNDDIQNNKLTVENLLTDTQTKRIRFRLLQIKERIDNIFGHHDAAESRDPKNLLRDPTNISRDPTNTSRDPNRSRDPILSRDSNRRRLLKTMTSSYSTATAADESDWSKSADQSKSTTTFTHKKFGEISSRKRRRVFNIKTEGVVEYKSRDPIIGSLSRDRRDIVVGNSPPPADRRHATSTTTICELIFDQSASSTSVASAPPPKLHVDLLATKNQSNFLIISVNLFTGRYLCDLSKLENRSLLDELERILNFGLWQNLKSIIIDIKLTLFLELCKKSMACIPVQICDYFSMLNQSTSIFRSLSKHKLFLRFNRYDQFLLIAELNVEEPKNDLKINYYLSNLISDDQSAASGACSSLKTSSLIELDKNLIVKRHSKLRKNENNGRVCVKRRKVDSKKDFDREHQILIDELISVINLCDHRIPLMLLCQEFDQKGVKYQLIDSDPILGNNVLKIIGFSCQNPTFLKESVEKLWTNVVSCTVRLLHDKNRMQWNFEWVFSQHSQGYPLKRQGNPEHATDDVIDRKTRISTRNWPVSQQPEQIAKCVDDFLATMCTFARMEELIRRFVPVYRESDKLRDVVDLKICTNHKVVLAYGLKKHYLVSVEYRYVEKSYFLTLGYSNNEVSVDGHRSKPYVSVNPHGLIAHFLQTLLNETQNLALIMQILHVTFWPLHAAQLLPQLPVPMSSDYTVPSAGQFQPSPAANPLGHVFTILPVTETEFRILYRWNYCLDVVCLTNDCVAIRDGRNGLNSKIAARFSPIIGLKTFFEFHEKLYNGGSLDANYSAAVGSAAAAALIDHVTLSQPSTNQQQPSVSLVNAADSSKSLSPAKSTSAHDLKLFSPDAAPTPSPAVPPSPMTTGGHSSTTGMTPTPGKQQTNPSPACPNLFSQASASGVPLSPAPGSNAGGLFTPSPGAPLSNACMLMTPSPAGGQFPQPSPAPFLTSSAAGQQQQQQSSSHSPPVNNNNNQVQSPLSALNEFAALSSDSKLPPSVEYASSWGEMSGPPSSAATPADKDSTPRGSTMAHTPTPNTPSQQQHHQQRSIPSHSTSSTSGPTPAGRIFKEYTLTPSGEPIIVRNSTFLKVCSKNFNSNNVKDSTTPALQKFFGTISLFERLYKQAAEKSKMPNAP